MGLKHKGLQSAALYIQGLQLRQGRGGGASRFEAQNYFPRNREVDQTTAVSGHLASPFRRRWRWRRTDLWNTYRGQTDSHFSRLTERAQNLGAWSFGLWR